MTKDLTSGNPFKIILLFTLPLMLGNLFQQFYSLADTIIVGRFVGVNALAAVGATGSVNYLILGFVIGMCNGFAIPIAQLFGAHDDSDLRRHVANATWLCIAWGVVLTVSEESWKTLKPIFESIAAKAEGEPCVTHIGLNGAGHFVKMVHNGIEYSDMQLIAESYDLMRRGLGMTPAEIGDVFEEWNKTELDSYLIEITAEVLHQVDKKTGKPLVDLIVDHAGMKGTGTWTVQTALSLAVPVTGIAEAVFARGLSSEADLREEAQKQGFAGPDGKLNLNDDEKKAFIEDIRQALYASKIVAYAQGFNEITTAAKEYGWDIDLAAVARIWRGGCIIRAKFLNRISEAFESGEANVSLLFAPYFKNAIESAEKSWRNVVAQAAVNGLPTPAFASSLSYFDGLRSKRLPAALIQGQRDYFGAHTYQRVDQPGAFHTLWAEPGREEIEV